VVTEAPEVSPRGWTGTNSGENPGPSGLLSRLKAEVAPVRRRAANGVVSTGLASPTLGPRRADGKLDLVTANSGSNNVTVFVGSGYGTFAAQSYAVGDTPPSVALGDVNGDGKTDLVTANFGSDNVTVLLNQAGVCGLP